MSTEYNYMGWRSCLLQYMSTECNYMEWRYRIQLYGMKELFTASIWVQNAIIWNEGVVYCQLYEYRNTIIWNEGVVYCQYMSTECNYMEWRCCLLPVYEYRIQLYETKVSFTASIWVENTIICNEGVVYCQYMSTEYNYMEWRCCLLPVYEYRIQLYGMKVVVYCQYISREYN